MFANISACTIHGHDDACWMMKQTAHMLRRWCSLSNKVWLYNYNYTMLVAKNTLTPMVTRLRRSFPRWNEWGVWGFYDQDEADWSMTGITTRYVRTRLCWDAGADVDAILDDYFSKWFGPSARPMQRYYAALENAFSTSTQHGHEDTILPTIYTPPLMATLDRLMRDAQARATAEPYQTRVRLDRLIYDLLCGFVAFEKAKQRCDYAGGIVHLEAIIDARAQMNTITPFMGWRPYPVYDPPWELSRMRRLDGLVSGQKGDLIAVLPDQARFRTDPHDEGRFERWMAPDYPQENWRHILTTAGWECHGLQVTKDGRPYLGLGWYRMKVDVPAHAAGKPVHLFVPAVVSEAWVWVNGQYVGRRAWTSPWRRPHEMELAVTDAVVPGQPNQITVRVRATSPAWGCSGIYERMFLFAPGAAE